MRLYGALFYSHALHKESDQETDPYKFSLYCEEHTGIRHSNPTPSLLDALAKYFGPDGTLNKCSFDELHTIATTIYYRYYTNRAWDASQDMEMWTEEKYGPTTNIPIPSTSSLTADTNARLDSSSNSNTKSTSGQRIETWTGDRVLSNNISFLKATSSYLEFCSAVAEGDVGRMVEIIKVWALCCIICTTDLQI